MGADTKPPIVSHATKGSRAFTFASAPKMPSSKRRAVGDSTPLLPISSSPSFALLSSVVLVALGFVALAFDFVALVLRQTTDDEVVALRVTPEGNLFAN